ncbi:signal transduction histidine kinase [Actinoplanes lutulentus]|uniref:histidine kinase n=1 Tax=Actinoplanes lutulentus TaxID=1287878 RepID=A0A327ZIL9_9ACTN|nr:sensor histidine kinase [Actinoplanes lutulentus]MBB2943970.1 signal transduction histidine kinase [Actinoplanes lutulentus]RAK42797.1 signal transduction histidine kinase [Actinoplanes lutulentus]
MAVHNALEALSLRPTVFLRSPWPWRSLAYLLCGALIGWATVVAVVALLIAGTLLSVLVVGFAGFVAVVLSGIVVARLERRRLRLVDVADLPDPHVPVTTPGVRAWVRVRLREEVTWRELGYAALSAGLLCWMDALVIGGVGYTIIALLGAPWFIDDEPLSNTLPLAMLGVPLTVVLAYPITAWAGARAAMARAMLAPRTDERLVEVTRSRARLVDAFEVERRRIERDLHDGAQQRLVALSMQLGLARLELPAGSPAAEPIAAAHELAKQALTELRELIRGVHPQVLTGRGLAAAVGEVASTAPLPVDLDFDLPGRLPPAVEVTAYFVTVEALTNIAKHSGASRAAVAARLVGGRLLLEVRDDGRGGADPSAGSGLVGLADRAAVLDGTVTVSSPPGGPTVLRAEIPVLSGEERS